MPKKREGITELEIYTEKFLANIDRDRKQLERELKVARQTGNYAEQADILYNLAFDFYDLPQATKALQAALEAAQKTNDASLQVEVGLGLIDVLKEDWLEKADFNHEQIIQIITPLLAVSETLETPTAHQHLLLELAGSYYELNDYAQARVLLQQIVDAPAEHPEYLSIEVSALTLLRDICIEFENAAQTKVIHYRLKQRQGMFFPPINSRSMLF